MMDGFDRRNRKRSFGPFALFASVSLMLVLWSAGCGGSAAPAATTGAPATSAPGTGAQVTLRFWMQQDNLLQAAMTDLINSFQQANPNIKVQLDAFPFAEYHQKVSTAIAGGDPPDVFWMDIRTASFAQQGALLPLDQYITAENRSDYLPAAWAEAMYQGKTYGVPMHELTEAIFVNTKLAQDAAIDLPTTVEKAWTWQQFEDAAKKLTKRSGDQTTVWGFGVQRQLQDWSVLPVVYQHGGKALSDDLKKASGALNSAATVEAMSWYGNLFTQDKVISVDVIPDGFPTGKIAMFQAPSSYRPVLDKSFPDLKYTIVPLFKDKQCAVMTGGWNVSISATTKNVKEAWLLTDWLTRAKHAEWVDKSGYLPARKSLIDSAPKFKENPWAVFMQQLQQCAANRPATAKYTFFSDTYKAAITNIATGQNAQAALDAAAQKIDAELAR
jgi:ABC-type glycerol-3-phosphate transport system substrate-binding protein